MDEPENTELREGNLPRNVDVARPRAVGSPLARGDAGSKPATPLLQGESPRVTPMPPRDDDPTDDQPEMEDLTDRPTSLNRAVKGVRMALPFVQKILPLLDGQVIATLANLLAPRPQAPAPPMNLAPLENGITELQTHHRMLREQIAEQNTSLKKVQDRLEMVQEATDRNTLEQQELLEDLKSVRRKVTVFFVIALLLLLGSIGLNVVLYLYMRGILR
ncbi:MAG TPA: hypothetical protein VFB43_14050 [Terracidiphilus sp.]|nr:hypothetical protein [Terracidiphilus sp.]